MLDYLDDITRCHKLAPAVLAAALSACATETVLLNSERIEQRFGSYGIDVLASEAGLRRSSLYSAEDGIKVCRTYAVVRFTDEPDTSINTEHAKVLAGNSLGAVFKANGWNIHKQTLHIGTIIVDDGDVLELMSLDGPQSLALHVYQLLLARGNRIFEYATIVEVHHPDYLAVPELLTIYSYDESESLRSESLRELKKLVTGTSVD